MIPEITLIALALSMGSQLPAETQVESALQLQSTQVTKSVAGELDATGVDTAAPDKRGKAKRNRKPIRPMDKVDDVKKKETRKSERTKPADAREALKKRFDADGDGKLSEAERATMKAAMGKRRQEAGQKGQQKGQQKGKKQGEKAGNTREELLKRFDTDGDGKLNEAERAAAKKAVAKRRQQSGQQGEKKGGEEGARKKGKGPKRREVKRKKPAKNKDAKKKEDGDS